MKLKDLMSSEVATVRPDESIRRAAALMRDERVGLLPVIDGRRVIGVLTDRDLVVRALADNANPIYTVDEAMSPDVATIDEEAEMAEAIERMKERKVRRLIVTRDGELTGVISADDVVAKMSDDPQVRELSQALADANSRTRMSR